MTLRNLGGLSLENGGRPVVGAANQRQRLAILAVIANGNEQGISRDRLQAIFWPDSDTEHARSALNQALYALRRDIGESNLLLGTATLRLNPDVIRHDAGDFERAIERGDHAGALRLYRGPFLDGVHLEAGAEFEAWVESERRRLAQRRAIALEREAREATKRGDLSGAIGHWHALAEADPLNAKVALGLMQALAAAGDRAGAVRYAERHADALQEELNLPPDPAIAAFVARLRAGELAGVSVDPGSAEQAGHTPVRSRLEQGSAPAVQSSRRRGQVVGALAVVAIVGMALVVSRWRGGGDGYSIGRSTQLTLEPGLEIDPALSPDGRSVAYTAGSLSLMRIYVRQRGGRPLRVVGDSGLGQRRPLWSPDGTQLLFLHGRFGQNLSVVPALGGVPRLIAPPQVTAAAWAPDGQRVAYVRGDSLFIQPIEGGEPRRVTIHPDMFALAWSPDGRLIAFASGNSKFAISNLSSFGTVGTSRILVVPAEGGAPVSVTDRQSLNLSPAWAPDSRRLLFISDRDGPRDVYLARLGASGAPVGRIVRLTVGLSAHSVSLSADGRRMAYSVFDQRSNVWSLPVDAGAPLGQDAASPVTTGSHFIEDMMPTADGKRLYFDASRAGNADIYRMTLPDGEPVRITADPAGENYPSESPDGKWIAFHSEKYGSKDIMVMPAGGGVAQRVTSDSTDETWPRWSPDSRSLAWAVEFGASAGLYQASRNADGSWGSPRKVSPIGNEPSWRPDGEALIVSSEPTVWLVPLGGGPQRLLYAPRPGTDDPLVESAQWMPDGRSVVMKSHDPNDVVSFWTMSVPDGRVRLLARLDDPSRTSPRDELATDGRRLYFAIHDRQSDIFVAEVSGLQ